MTKIGYTIICCLIAGILNGQIIGGESEEILPKDQKRQVTGKVLYKNTEGELSPIPGAHVVVKGTHRGTTTDSLGEYQIKKVTGHDILTFSFVSMQTEERVAGLGTQVDVVLRDDHFNLSDVVVLGHLPVRKEDLQSSVSSVETKEFDLQPVTNALTGLQGRVAGASITNGSGIGNNVYVRIRGNSSFTARNDPLYLFEGMPLSLDFAQISSFRGHAFRPQLDFSPVAIGSMKLIRDAATGSIYGARAAKGVVLLESPRGQAGDTKITYSSRIGFSEPIIRQYEMLDTAGYFDYLDDLAPTMNIPGIEDHRDILNALNIPRSQFQGNTNWKDHVFQNGNFFENRLTVSGGNEQQQFYIGAALQNSEGALQGQEREKKDLVFSYQLQATDRLSASLTGLYTGIDYESLVTGDFHGSPLNAGYWLPPHLTSRDSTGKLIHNFPTIHLDNPAALTKKENFFNHLNNNRWLGVLDLEYRLGKHFLLKYKGGADFNHFQEERFISEELRVLSSGRGRYLHSQTNNLMNLNEGSLNFSKIWGDHFVDASSGVSHTYNRISGTWAGVSNVASAQLAQLQHGSGTPLVFNEFSQQQFLSFFGNARYQYQDKYLLMGSFRYDGSSVLAPGNQYEAFWGISPAWVISRESFFDLSWIDRLKLYAGYGKTGNSALSYGQQQQFRSFYSAQPPSSYRGLGSQFSGRGGYLNEPSLLPMALGNEELGWEITHEFSGGLDFTLFDQRLQGNLAGYHRITHDMIVEQPMRPSSGFSYYLGNAWSVRNSGIELNLESRNLSTEQFSWSTSLNLAYNDNELLKAGSVRNERNFVAIGVFVQEEGYPLSAFRVFEMDQVDPETGDIVWVDQNGDGEITDADRVVKGQTSPPWYGGMNNSFQWKGFQLDVLLQFATGHQVYNLSRHATINMADVYNQGVEVEDRWREPGDVTDIPRAAYLHIGNNRQSDRFLEDAGYLRLKAVSLSYTAEKPFNIQAIKRLQVFLSVQNLATLTGYSGHDPEIYFPEVLNTRNQYDIFNLPQNRTYTLGLTVEL